MADLSAVEVALLTQGANDLATKYPTVDALQAYVSGSVSDPFSAEARTEHAAIAGTPAGSVPPWQRWEAQIKKAVCTDFGYCGKKADVDADIKKYIPQVVQALFKNGVGHLGPSWLAPVLAALGFTAGWQAAIAAVAAYCIIEGLDLWCQCGA